MISQRRAKRIAGYAACSVAAIGSLFLLLQLQTGTEGNESILAEVTPTTTADQLSQPVQYSTPIGVQLVPGAQAFYAPRIQPIGPPVIDGDPMGIWGDIFQRVTNELATDTAEVANLDRQARI